MLIAVTGGIGAGKSSVAAELGRLGAVVVDADELAREVVRPPSPVLAQIVAEFGPDILRYDGELNSEPDSAADGKSDGELDRRKLGELVFADTAARIRLEGITHPAIRKLAAQRFTAAPEGAVVVYDIPLLVESNSDFGYDLIVVVTADESVRIKRLVAKGLSEPEARQRIHSQASDAQRARAADIVITNNGTQAELAQQASELWNALNEKR